MGQGDERGVQRLAPACFPVRIYRLWSEVNARCGNGHVARSVCADCLPSYALRMRAEGRCERPGTQWRFDDGAIAGVDAA